MLALSVMIVVFVLDEKINLGRKLTAEQILRFNTKEFVYKSATVT